MMNAFARGCAALVILLTLPPARSAGQHIERGRLVTPGSLADDSARDATLLSNAGLRYPLLRSASTLASPVRTQTGHIRIALLPPEQYAIRNSALPYSINDGALWAGRGFGYQVRAGVWVETGPLRLVLAPEFFRVEDRPYPLLQPRSSPPRPPGRSGFSSPWHTGPASIDLPIRFGGSAYSEWDFGQTSLDVSLGGVTTGVAKENEWWGPGIRNAIVMSTNASGIPRFFVRPTHPVATRLGTFDARLFVGGLRESRYFDSNRGNDRRSISAVALTWSPRTAPNVSVGFARAIYAPVSRWSRVPIRLLDAVIRNPGRPNNHLPGDTVVVPGPDQVFSLFGRWVLSGFEVYAEWARNELPTSLRDFLTAPNHTQGYTIGLQWAQPVGPVATARVQLETTYLGKSPTLRDRPVGTWYTSRAVPQGYTNQGQVIGAAIGPGADAQWLAVDYFAPRWQAGGFASRIRWDGEALYTFPTSNFVGNPNKWCSHDTSLLFGVRGALRAFFGLVELSYAVDRRRNVFFQQFSVCGRDMDFRDVRDETNTVFELRFTPP
jgi:hypothetical protein